MRTTSPSSSVTGRPPISISLTISALAMVDLPEPERPVKNTVKPCLSRGGEVRPAGTQVDDLLSEISARTAAGERVLVRLLAQVQQRGDGHVARGAGEGVEDHIAGLGIRLQRQIRQAPLRAFRSIRSTRPLIRIGQSFLFSGEWWILLFPSLVLLALALSVNLVGDWLRDALNPKLQ